MRFLGFNNFRTDHHILAQSMQSLALPVWHSSVLSVIGHAEICPSVVYSATGDVSALFSHVNDTKKGPDSEREGLRSMIWLHRNRAFRITNRINYGKETPSYFLVNSENMKHREQIYFHKML